jgi:hypothetical protein
MISYCPLEDDPPIRPSRPVQAPPIKISNDPSENTECNYLVMFFILGVLGLAITDNIRK